MGSRLRDDNRGLSLVEILVVVAIIAVVGGVGVWSVNTMSGKPAQKCAQQIVYAIERHRTTCMSKVTSKLEIGYDSDGNVAAWEFYSNTDVMPTSATEYIEVGSTGIDVSYRCSDGSQRFGTLILQFDRASGAFKPQADGTYCTEIIIRRGGREHVVNLVPLTGKVYID